MQAIELQNKAIILQEKLLGYDHPQVAYSYSNLALYFHTSGSPQRAFEYMFKALNILKIVCGQNHPDISSLYLNIGLMYTDIENYPASIECINEALYRNLDMFGEDHQLIASCHSGLAQAYQSQNDFRKALEQQTKAYNVFIKIYDKNDAHCLQAKAQMDQFAKISVFIENTKPGQKSRPIGSNKVAPPEIKGNGLDQEQATNKHFTHLMNRLQNPRQRTYLDVLEYNFIREQQSKVDMTKMMEEAKARSEAQKKEESEKKDNK